MSFGPTFDLASLNGFNGFFIDGISTGDGLGRSVSTAGDFNGDGIDDLLIGAPGALGARPSGSLAAGESYIIFGARGIGNSGSFNLSNLNGSNGFALKGIDSQDDSGYSVSGIGDINNDGFDDIIIGAYNADAPEAFSGESYVVFGRQSVGLGASLNLSSLNGSNGFIVRGLNNSDFSGVSVSGAGDVNGDGFDDFIVGAPGANPNGFDSGQSYVIFGGRGIGITGSFDLRSLNGSNGFALNGSRFSNFSDRAGASVSSAGDFNGDGFDDLIIGAPDGEVNGVKTGKSYIVFGRSSFTSGTIELASLNGNNGFVLRGVDRLDDTGSEVSSAGDINNDGFDDVLIHSENNGGETYVVFGGSNVGLSGSFNLADLNGSNGFVIRGNGGGGYGRDVSEVGDVNNDGIDDIIIGSSFFGSYVIFGGSGIGSSGSFNLSDLNSQNGFALSVESRYPGRAVSGLGDINGDGIDDLITANRSTGANAGRSYVVFGRDTTARVPFAKFFSFDQWVKFQRFDDGVNIPLTPAEVGGVSLQSLFDEAFYLDRNRDVKAVVENGALTSGYEHFIRHGRFEGRDPSVLYSEEAYLRQYADVVAAVRAGAFSSGFEHYINYGHIENRVASTAFNPIDYLTQNPDVAGAVTQGFLSSGFEHFVESGANEGRVSGVMLFEEAFYLAQNPDVAQVVTGGSFSSGLEHFARYGQREGRISSSTYREGGYLGANSDVAAAVSGGGFSSGFEHFVEFGRIEGRSLGL